VLSFRLVSAYVILESARKSGVRWRVGVRHTPFAQSIDREMSRNSIGLRIPGVSSAVLPSLSFFLSFLFLFFFSFISLLACFLLLFRSAGESSDGIYNYCVHLA